MLITLNTGREIGLSDLNQSHTYAGLLLGVPDREYNQELITQFRKTAKKEMHQRYAYVVTPPVLEVDCSDMLKCRHQRLGKHVERIPYIACTALFRSGGVQREGDEDISIMSAMAIVWFQDEFALPIDEAVIDKIKVVNWDNLAEAWLP